jgi:hypothetical protein
LKGATKDDDSESIFHVATLVLMIFLSLTQAIDDGVMDDMIALVRDGDYKARSLANYTSTDGDDSDGIPIIKCAYHKTQKFFSLYR